MSTVDHSTFAELRDVEIAPGYKVGRDGSFWSFRDGHPKRITLAVSKSGYLMFRPMYSGKRRAYFAHRLVLHAFVGPCPPGMETLHRDGNPKNNCLDNIRWGSPAENGADRIRHGKHRRGARKLTPADVLVIRRLAATRMYQRDIAKHVGTSRQTVGNVLRGEIWAYVEESA